MSLDNVLSNLQKARETLWNSNALCLIPNGVAEAARLTDLAISQIEAQVTLERALAELKLLSKHQTSESTETAYNLITKAAVALSSHNSEKYDEWSFCTD